MCFFVKSIYKELTANRDITCYKILEVVDWDSGMLLSPYCHHVYFLGELNRLNEKLRVSYLGGVKVINEGFHSYCEYFSYPHLKNLLNVPIFKCTIPKGAKYYKNSMEYVSDAIIINKRIN